MINTYRGIDRIRRAWIEATVEGLERSAARVAGRAANDAPLDTGDLRASFHISDPQVTPYSASISVSFDLVYARRQHEETEWQHPKGGKAKFLSDAVDAERALLPLELRAAQRRRMGR